MCPLYQPHIRAQNLPCGLAVGKGDAPGTTSILVQKMPLLQGLPSGKHTKSY
jgi:hypothetical protein